MGRVMQTAAFSLAEVQYATGDNIFIKFKNRYKSSIHRQSKTRKCFWGVLPTFDSHINEDVNDFKLTALARGGQQVQRLN